MIYKSFSIYSQLIDSIDQYKDEIFHADKYHVLLYIYNHSAFGACNTFQKKVWICLVCFSGTTRKCAGGKRE